MGMEQQPRRGLATSHVAVRETVGSSRLGHRKVHKGVFLFVSWGC